MNADTTRKVEEMETTGWYPMSTVLGEGGWPAVYVFAYNWKNYILKPAGGDILRIVAKDDQTAVRAFNTLFVSDEGAMICEEVTTLRQIEWEV